MSLSAPGAAAWQDLPDMPACAPVTGLPKNCRVAHDWPSFDLWFTAHEGYWTLDVVQWTSGDTFDMIGRDLKYHPNSFVPQMLDLTRDGTAELLVPQFQTAAVTYSVFQKTGVKRAFQRVGHISASGPHAIQFQDGLILSTITTSTGKRRVMAQHLGPDALHNIYVIWTDPAQPEGMRCSYEDLSASDVPGGTRPANRTGKDKQSADAAFVVPAPQDLLAACETAAQTALK